MEKFFRAVIAAIALAATFSGRGRITGCGLGDLAGERFDVVLSNPPYIKSAVIPGLMPDVALHEPASALDVPPDLTQLSSDPRYQPPTGAPISANALQGAAQRQALGHAEAVLLVDDGQRQPLELHLLLDHGMGAHHQGRTTAGHLLQHGGALLFLLPATEPGHLQAARRLRQLWSRHQKARDLIQLGAYQAGNDPELDLAVRLHHDMNRLLQQDMHSAAPIAGSISQLGQILHQA